MSPGHNDLYAKQHRGWLNLTHWGRVMHLCISKLTIIGSDNGLSSGRRRAIIWTNVGILLIWPLETNFGEILIKIYTFSVKKMHLIMSFAKWWPFCLGLYVLTLQSLLTPATYFTNTFEIWAWINHHISLFFCLMLLYNLVDVSTHANLTDC